MGSHESVSVQRSILRNPSTNRVELSDDEAQLYSGYENGVLVQSYWSSSGGDYVIPGATYYNLVVNNGTLNVGNSSGIDPFGTSVTTNETITISTSAGRGVQITINGQTVQYSPGQVTSLDITCTGATNTVDLQNVPGGVTSISIQGAGNTTLEAPGGSTNVWHITGTGSGTLDVGSQVGIVSFSGITNETGGGTDDFMFQGGSVPGFIDGGPGAGVATLDYSALAGPVTVNLQSGTADDIGGTFSNINNFVGSASTANTLIGPDAGATWDITGANSGSVNGSTFSSFENLTGGAGSDQFVFFPSGSVSGSIDGGGGTNTLDYSNRLAGPVTVNLQIDTAPGIARPGTFANLNNSLPGALRVPRTRCIGPDAGATWDITGAPTPVRPSTARRFLLLREPHGRAPGHRSSSYSSPAAAFPATSMAAAEPTPWITPTSPVPLR